MRRLVLCAAMGLICVASVCQLGHSSQRPVKAGSQNADFTIGEPIRHKNLTIFPVLSKTERNADRFITLDEGLRAHTVEVIEMGARRDRPISRAVVYGPDGEDFSSVQGGSAQRVPRQRAAAQTANAPVETGNETAAGNEVNRLMVINRSGKPLYLMPGEVIVGGSQDRTIAEETTIAATGKPVPIDVFCVEHGRWGGRDVGTSVRVLASLDPVRAPASASMLAGEARKGKFVVSAGSLNKAGRVAVQSGKGQQEVWDQVQTINGKLNVNSQSGAFTFNYCNPKVVENLEPYLKDLTGKVAATSRVVGVVVAVNGKIETVDVFESTPLFRKLWPKLLKSYALDAVNFSELEQPVRRTASYRPTVRQRAALAGRPAHREGNSSANQTADVKKPCTVSDATAFLDKIVQGSTTGTKQTKGGLVVTHHETKEASCHSAFMGGAMGGMGGAVHSAGYAN